MLAIPPEVLATWPTPNYDNPVSRGPELIIVEIITLTLVLICLPLRLWVKIRILRKPNWDDWFMVAATIFGTGLTITVILANTLYHWNHHIWDIPTADLTTARKVSFAAQMMYLFATALAKVSILLSYTQLAVPGTKFHLLSKTAIVLIALGQFSFLVTLLTQCVPTSSYWTITKLSDDCPVREGHFLMAQAVFTVLSDVAVWVLPLPTLYRARLPLGQRVALIVLFSAAAVVVAAAVLRTYWLWWAVGETWDATWECFYEWIWTAVEVHVGIICGCVPWLKSLVTHWRGRGPVSRGGGGRSAVGSGSGGRGAGMAMNEYMYRVDVGAGGGGRERSFKRMASSSFTVAEPEP